MHRHQLTNNPGIQPNTFRKTAQDKAKTQQSVLYGRCVGGSSVHFTANFWRFHEIDFIERSKVGEIPGANLVDWPITYQDLEPYYTKVEWEVGVSGLAGASPFDPPRSKPYPMPPLPVKRLRRDLRARGAKARLSSVSRADGDSLAAAAGAQRMRQLRILSRFRLRSWREVQFSGRDDSSWPKPPAVARFAPIVTFTRSPRIKLVAQPVSCTSMPSEILICRKRRR